MFRGPEAVLHREAYGEENVLGANEARSQGGIEEAVERASGELLERYRKPIEANPGMKLIDIVSLRHPLALWFTYPLIAETKTLE